MNNLKLVEEPLDVRMSTKNGNSTPIHKHQFLKILQFCGKKNFEERRIDNLF